MRRTLRFAAGFALAAALLAVLPFARGAESDPAGREWYQLRGNASRSGCSLVEGLGGKPVQAWKRKLPGTVVGEPVTWSGVTFVAAQAGKTRRLLAFRSTTGEPLGSQELGGGGARLALATWQSVVIVGEGERIRTFRHDGTKFAPGWSKSGQFGGAPCVFRGYCFVGDGDELVCFDVMRGGATVAKSAAVMESAVSALPGVKELSKEKRIGGPMSVCVAGADEVQARAVVTIGRFVLLTRAGVAGLGTAKTTMSASQTELLGELDSAATDDDRWALVPCHIDAEKAGAGASLVISPRPYKASDTCGKFVPDLGAAQNAALVTAPAVCCGAAFAFTRKGDLQSWRAGGQMETLLPAENTPQGSRPCAGSGAGGIAYFGSWAVAAAERRVAWTLPVPTTTAMIPVGDRRVVVGAADELLCFVDESVGPAPTCDPAPVASGDGAASGDAPAAGAAPTRTADAPPAKAPGEIAEGVLLADGRQIECTWDLDSRGRFILHPKDGGADVTALPNDVVVAEKAGEIDYRGDDAAAFRIWRGAVRATLCDAYEEVFKEYAKALFVNEARTLMGRMRAAAASEARLQKLDALLNGKTQRNDENRRKKLAAQEKAATDAACEVLLRGAEWCRKRDLLTAATVALNEVARLDPSRDADVDARVGALVPATFPWKGSTSDSAVAATKWRTWAEALLPASAEFVGKDDDVWGGRIDNAPWNDGATLGFRTRNVLLFIRDQEPALCGKVLQLSEGTVRALQVFLHDGLPDDVMSGDEGRLEIRIHANAKDYHSEESSTGAKAMEWSAGYFSPGEKISRFYVERGGEDGKGPANVDELTRVLTHEFTHHYIGVRWVKDARGGGGAGCFVVEGMAEFVQNQAHQMDRRGLSFDDETVPGIDGVAQLEIGGKGGATTPSAKWRIFQPSEFVNWSHAKFDALRNEPDFGRVRLRHSLGREARYSERALWYDEAGALCFFLLVKKGPETRKSFVEYVRAVYAGGAGGDGWSRWGFTSAEQFDEEFRAFLRRVAGG
jgi:hypothetical protein